VAAHECSNPSGRSADGYGGEVYTGGGAEEGGERAQGKDGRVERAIL